MMCLFLVPSLGRFRSMCATDWIMTLLLCCKTQAQNYPQRVFVFTNPQPTEEELRWSCQSCEPNLRQLSVRCCAALLHNVSAQSVTDFGIKEWGEGEKRGRGPCSLPVFMQIGAPVKESREAKKDPFNGVAYVHTSLRGKEAGWSFEHKILLFCSPQLEAGRKRDIEADLAVPRNIELTCCLCSCVLFSAASPACFLVESSSTHPHTAA